MSIKSLPCNPRPPHPGPGQHTGCWGWLQLMDQGKVRRQLSAQPQTSVHNNSSHFRKNYVFLKIICAEYDVQMYHLIK